MDISTSFEYDPNGNQTALIDGNGSRTEFVYDPDSGLKVAETNALGQTTLYEYNDRGQITVVGGSSQYPVEYGYDDFGRMTDLYTLRGATNGWDRTQWLYDQATGLVTNKLYPAVGGTGATGPSYTYTPDNKLATRTWARGITTTYSYDSIGQCTGILYGGTNTPSVAIAYNRLGQKTQVIDASGTNTFAYSDTLMLTNETQLASFDLARSYDSLGRSTGITLDDPSYSVQYSYDDLGRFSSVSSSVSSVSSVVDYSYLTGSSLISGYTTDTGLAVSCGFEDNRDNKTQVLNQFGTNVISQFDYQYDALNRRTQRLDTSSASLPSVQTNLFDYNGRSELTSAAMSTNDYSYAYDSIGNRTDCSVGSVSQSYVANELNQYTQITDNSLTNNCTYDADGNLLSDGTSTYTWNGENRLIQASNATAVVTFKYDYQGRRFEKTVNATNTTRFVYDGWAMIHEESSAATNSYVYGLDLSGSLQGAGTIGGLLSANLNGTMAMYCYDANGNVTDLIDTNGTSVAHYEYDAFGNETQRSGSVASQNPFRFSTKYFDTETGLLYYGFRYYNPETGRWLNRDPVFEYGFIVTSLHVSPAEQNLKKIYLRLLSDPVWYSELIKTNQKSENANLYMFIANEPIGRWDLLGLMTIGECFGVSPGDAQWGICKSMAQQQGISIDESASSSCVSCLASCTGDFLIGYGGGMLTEKAAKAVVSRVAKKAAQKYAVRAIPVVGAFFIGYDSGTAILCTVDCVKEGG